jgi:outer membrane protein OmpA-like peptidoglycan-associated protein
MKKPLALLLGCMPFFGFAQQFTGFTSDNYSGIPGVIQNPSTIAGSKYKLSFNIVSLSTLAGNNAYEMKSDRFRKFDFSDMKEGEDYFKSSNTNKKNLWMNADIIGPSLMFTAGRKSGFGLYTRARLLVNENNLSDATFRHFNSDSGLYDIPIQEENLQFKAHAFGEAGITYGRIIYNSGEHLVKMGITGKYIVGLGAGAMYSNKMNVNLAKNDFINTLQGDASVRYSSNLDNIDDNFDDIFNNKSGNKGWGMDLGFSYEWRPTSSAWLSLDQTPYRVKVNASITDIGAVKYNNSEHGDSYAVNASGRTTDDLDKKDGETFDEYFSRLEAQGILTAQTHADKMKVKLPTALRVDADYHIYKRLFVNAGTVLNLIGNNKNPYSAHYTSSFTITPRLEKKWFSIYSPFYYNMLHKKMAWGAGVRLAQFYVGSGSILSNMLSSKNVSAADVHIGVAVSLYKPFRKHHRRERDDDEPVVRKTPEPVQPQPVQPVPQQPLQPTPAPVQNRVDTVEKKVEVVKEVQLTHDKDNDGVTDEKDACPDVPGEVALNGCPDKDKDGIADKDDKCVDVPGTAKYNGCPIPDTDGDGVNDENDKCPTVAGLEKYNGCPIPDSDGDGVNDEMDKCPATPGKPANNGCPEIKQDVVKKVNIAAKSIYFLSGKDIIQKVSFPKLNMLVGILKADKEMLISIEGHTDNKGNAAVNQKLSEKRAVAVKNYLVKKGIDAGRITAQGFGDTKPITSNATAAGRAKNRRVELHLSYK